MGLAIAACVGFAFCMAGAACLSAAWMIRHLKGEIRWLRERVDYYEQRGDRALDLRASLALGTPVHTASPALPHRVSTPDAPTMSNEEQVRRFVLGDPELANAGQLPS